MNRAIIQTLEIIKDLATTLASQFDASNNHQAQRASSLALFDSLTKLYEIEEALQIAVKDWERNKDIEEPYEEDPALLEEIK